MGDASEKLVGLTDTDLVAKFREALLAVYPVLLRLDCLEDDSRPYDDFDEVAECLWRVAVCKSIGWREGLDSPPRLSRYGWDEVGPDGFLAVSGSGLAGPSRFVCLIGDRRLGPEPFNAAQCVSSSGLVVSVPWGPELRFEWVRKNAEQIAAADRPCE
ncbi:MAG TPA: hypothetical protein VH643_36360 [Gemmataceae bacterium]